MQTYPELRHLLMKQRRSRKQCPVAVATNNHQIEIVMRSFNRKRHRSATRKSWKTISIQQAGGPRGAWVVEKQYSVEFFSNTSFEAMHSLVVTKPTTDVSNWP